MSGVQLIQSYVQLFEGKKNKRLRKADFREFLKLKKEAAPPIEMEKFRFGDGPLAALRGGEIIDESLAEVFVLFVREVNEGTSDLALRLKNDPTYDYSWTDDFTGLTAEETFNRLFVLPQRPTFAGSFTQVVQYPLYQIEKMLLRAAHRGITYWLSEHHTWCADEKDARLTSYRTNCTIGAHFIEPRQRVSRTDDELIKLAEENWQFFGTLDQWDDLYALWYHICRESHVWAVKPKSKATDDPWDVRISNMSVLPVSDLTYFRLRAGSLSAHELVDASFFQVPTVYFFIVGAAENPRARFTRREKTLAEMSSLLNQLAHMVPPQGHVDHRKDLHLLSFGGTPVTEKTLRSKSFKPLNDFLKEAKPNKCRLHEMIMGETFAYARARDAVYAYRAHLDRMPEKEVSPMA